MHGALFYHFPHPPQPALYSCCCLCLLPYAHYTMPFYLQEGRWGGRPFSCEPCLFSHDMPDRWWWVTSGIVLAPATCTCMPSLHALPWLLCCVCRHVTGRPAWRPAFPAGWCRAGWGRQPDGGRTTLIPLPSPPHPNTACIMPAPLPTTMHLPVPPPHHAFTHTIHPHPSAPFIAAHTCPSLPHLPAYPLGPLLQVAAACACLLPGTAHPTCH